MSRMVERIIAFIMGILGLFSCTAKQDTGNISSAISGKRVLVVYYSWGGNTKAVGDYIAGKIGADVYEIETATPYPVDYEECVRLVGQQGANYEPDILPAHFSVTDYDVIFIGSPCWWGTVANPVRSFLKRNDLSGKTVIPFMTAGTSGKRLQDIPGLCPGATVLDGIGIYNRYQVETETNTPDNMGDWKNKIDKWLNL